MSVLVAVGVPDLLPPSSVGDWGRIVVVLLCGVLAGMTIEILRRYWILYRRPPSSARAGHVLAIASSYVIFVLLIAYANLFQIGRDSVVEAITVPGGLAAGVVGVVGLYEMLRHLSGKSDRDDS